MLEGDLARLRIPPPGAPAQGERLWEHTCFEAFLAVPASAAYHELNVSPAGQWAAHAFARYREGGPLADDGLAPRITVSRTGDRLALEIVVALGRLARTYATGPLRLALAAVVEGESGALSYWALRHPPGRPDFHHVDAFALTLEPPRSPAGARAS